jgi:molybdopterin converting factor subunit 1
VSRAIRVQYFALLRDQAGRRDEVVSTDAVTAAQLYEELRAKYRFTLPADSLRVAINQAFAQWNVALNDGDAVVFIPPVAGG